jgi:proline iminopeptidase
VEIDWNADVYAALSASFTEWIHQTDLWRPDLWRRVADCPVPMRLIAAGDDIRPSWPLQQLASLALRGSFEVVHGVSHDFWALNAETWISTVQAALAQA